jgi:hypothetical protein
MSPEWYPRSKKEILSLGSGWDWRFSLSSLPHDTVFAAAVALYILRVFLWPAVREQKKRESEEIDGDNK